MKSGPKRRKRSPKIIRRMLVSPALDDAIWYISESEKRTFAEVAGMLVLLGTGVWRRLREHPHIRKGFAFDSDATFLLLAKLREAHEFFEVQADEADRVITRAHRFNERSDYYENN